jgi:hypothetical protein
VLLASGYIKLVYYATTFILYNAELWQDESLVNPSHTEMGEDEGFVCECKLTLFYVIKAFNIIS